MDEVLSSGVAVEIRMAEPGDVADVEACVAAAYEPYLERMPTPPAPLLDDYRGLVARGVVRVAVVDDGLVGLIVLWPEGDHLYIDNVAVDPRTQSRGVGAAMLDRAAEEARVAGLPELRLYTNEAMTENIDWYPRRGFVETDRRVEAGYRRVYFCRPVGPAPSA